MNAMPLMVFNCITIYLIHEVGLTDHNEEPITLLITNFQMLLSLIISVAYLPCPGGMAHVTNQCQRIYMRCRHAVRVINSINSKLIMAGVSIFVPCYVIIRFVCMCFHRRHCEVDSE